MFKTFLTWGDIGKWYGKRSLKHNDQDTNNCLKNAYFANLEKHKEPSLSWFPRIKNILLCFYFVKKTISRCGEKRFLN